MDEQPECRVCGRELDPVHDLGTRCPRCAGRQAALSWSMALAATLVIGLTLGADGGELALAMAGTAIGMPVALAVATVVHELAHAVAGVAMRMDVWRVVIGEGRLVRRFASRPEIELRALPFQGWTYADLADPAWYRTRQTVFLLAAPVVSAAAAGLAAVLGSWSDPLLAVPSGWMVGANALMAVVTLLPWATFGGRVRSDVVRMREILRFDPDDVKVMAASSAVDVALRQCAPAAVHSAGALATDLVRCRQDRRAAARAMLERAAGLLDEVEGSTGWLLEMRAFTASQLAWVVDGSTERGDHLDRARRAYGELAAADDAGADAFCSAGWACLMSAFHAGSDRLVDDAESWFSRAPCDHPAAGVGRAGVAAMRRDAESCRRWLALAGSAGPWIGREVVFDGMRDESWFPRPVAGP